MHVFVQQSVRNVCAKFKVDRLSSFSYWSLSSAHYPEIFSQQNSSNHENCNIKFPLETFSDQITVCQISFEIFDIKQTDTRAKKYKSHLSIHNE